MPEKIIETRTFRPGESTPSANRIAGDSNLALLEQKIVHLQYLVADLLRENQQLRDQNRASATMPHSAT